MKKIIAIAMALVMMMAIAVPAFAAVEGGSNSGSDTIISTLTTKEDGLNLGCDIIDIFIEYLE